MKHLILYITVLIVALTACSKKEAEDTEHDHDHGAVKLKITEYTNMFELFAETDLFVKGETTTILAHFTELKDFKPLKDVTITARLIIRNKEISQTINKPIRPGIYEFTLQPEIKGAGQLIFDIQNGEEKYKIEVDPIVVYDDEHTAALIAEKKAIDNINAINFTKEQSWKIDFETLYPRKEFFGKVIKSTAQILSNQSSEALITAKTNGVVKFHKNILEGQELIGGESLISISGKGLANDNAEVRFLEAKNDYDAAKADYDRKLALSQNQIVSEKEVESAKVEFENAKAVFDNLKTNFNANGQIVISPREGIVKHIYVTNGQYVEAGETLFSLASNDKLVVKAEVQQKNYPYLNSISSFNIRSFTNNKYYTKEELNGMLLSFGKNIDEDEGYLIPVNFQIDNNEELLTGSFVEIFIKTRAKNKASVVPNTSLVEEQSNYFVFVQLTPELFEKREVKIGLSDGINTEIISGLTENERIVSKGAIIVKLAAVSNSLDPHAGHVH